jgi:UDP-N-acetylglucosamine 4,6-dehydratase
MISGSVLITGGTGSLGQAILRRADMEGWDAAFTVFSRDEAKQAALHEKYPWVRCVLGDVRDRAGLEAAMRGADVVIHAAAYKRVPEAERQPIVCCEANVIGSANVVHAARKLGTPQVVGISTDKACQPINAYGATKLLMERMFVAEALERPDGPRFTLTRYGNVIASTGSVVPAFRAQAAAGGPLRLTDPSSTRFWITLDDAVDLIVEALALPSGLLLVPRSRASSMAVMAEAVAPGVPRVQIENRGGEKPHETLLNEYEAPYAVPSGLGYVIAPMVGPVVGSLREGFAYRSDTAPQYTVDSLRAVLHDLDGPRVNRTIVA